MPRTPLNPVFVCVSECALLYTQNSAVCSCRARRWKTKKQNIQQTRVITNAPQLQRRRHHCGVTTEGEGDRKGTTVKGAFVQWFMFVTSRILIGESLSRYR